MEFRVLGALEVVGDDGRPLPLGGIRQRALLATLLLHAGRPVTAGELIEAMWEAPPASAAHGVEVYVSKLRKLLAGAERPRERVAWRGGGYAALVDPGELDLLRFRALAARGMSAMAEQDPAGAAAALAGALSLWRGLPLGCIDGTPVAEQARRELEDERLTLIEARLEAELALGRHAELVGELRRLVAAHPEREQLWCKLMLALYRSGRQADALETYALARARFLDQLGLEPGPGLRRLQRQILAQDPALDAPHPQPVARSGPLRETTLPVPPSSFVGREAELAAAGALLSGTRLLTVIGPGGVGKTRFALELARRNAARFAGVACAALESLSEPALVPVELARALGVDSRTRDALEALGHDLGDRCLLLVVDNLEHLLEAAEDLHDLLSRAPGLRLVVTSREPLRLSCEQRFVLPALEPEDARRLFLARAGGVGASPDAGDPVVDALCRRLDRLPLAIELAASHTDTQTPEELLAALGGSLDLDGRRDPPARQRTLRATIDWSYGRLPAREQRALRRLAVFRGGCTPAAAERVAGATPETLRGLVEKSLLVLREGRYALLDTVGRYAAEKLAGREAASAEGCHTAWFLALARELEPPHYGGGTPEQYCTAAAELPNFRAALERAVERRDAGTALALVRSLAPYWYELDGLEVSHDAVLSALALDGGEAADRGHALYFVACVTMELARPSETYAHLASAEASFAAADDLGGLSMVENLRCFQSVMLGEAQRACAEGVRAVELARAAGSADLEMPATQHLALALCLAARESPTPDRARLEEARRLLEASREWLLDQGRDSAVADANLAVVLSELGAYEEALGHAQRALLLERERGTRRIAEALITIALSASGLERHRDAIRLLRVAERRLDDQGTARHDWIEESAARIAACARAALGDRGYEAACRQGAELSLDDAFELALATETRRAAARRSTAAQRTGPGR